MPIESPIENPLDEEVELEPRPLRQQPTPLVDRIRSYYRVLTESGRAISETPAVFVWGISRSGTTLLTTVLDSHSQVAMGYELATSTLPPPQTILLLLSEALAATQGQFERCGRAVQAAGHDSTALFFARCHRAGLTATDLQSALSEYSTAHHNRLLTRRDALDLSWRLVEIKSRRQSADYAGFKIGMSRSGTELKWFPRGRIVGIIRDPRDVVVSHLGYPFFDRTVDAICERWNRFLTRYSALAKTHPSRMILVRYEDLVQEPAYWVDRLFTFLGVRPEGDKVVETSKATILDSTHPNLANIRRGFFTSSIGRWESDLEAETARLVANRCADGMRRLGYLRD